MSLATRITDEQAIHTSDPQRHSYSDRQGHAHCSEGSTDESRSRAQRPMQAPNATNSATGSTAVRATAGAMATAVHMLTYMSAQVVLKRHGWHGREKTQSGSGEYSSQRWHHCSCVHTLARTLSCQSSLRALWWRYQASLVCGLFCGAIMPVWSVGSLVALSCQSSLWDLCPHTSSHACTHKHERACGHVCMHIDTHAHAHKVT